MGHDFYVLYDQKTLVASGISGSPFDDIHELNSVCKIQEHVALDFINNKKCLHDYIVKTGSNYSELIFKNSELLFKKKNMPDNIVGDLNYRIIFFDCLDIRFEVGSKLKLYFDIDLIDIAYKTNFLNVVNKSNSIAIIYVTEYKDPAKLLGKFKIDLLELYNNKFLELEFNRPNISVWAVRE